jgi:mRNA interferase MazF
MPKGNLTYKRGEIRFCKLDPTVGTELQKTRSCLIVQNDVMNQHGSLTIIMPFRPGSKNAPYIVNVTASSVNGLDQDRYIDVAQIRSIDNSRVLGLVGVLEEEYWELIARALNIVLDF